MKGLALTLGIFLLGTAASGQSGGFHITGETVARDFVGFGAQMNPYLYCRPNYGEMMERVPFAVGQNPYRDGLMGFGDVTEENVQDYELKVVALRPQHARIFTLLDWWSLKGDEFVAKGDPRMVESFLRTVRLAQRAGASVNLTLWFGEYFKFHPEETGRAFARLVAKLRRDHDLTNIRYLTIQNEVNGEGRHGGMRLTFDQYHRLYRALDAELCRQGIRDQVKIISGDLLSTNQVLWLTDLALNLSDVSDGFSIHAYWDYWDTPKLRRRASEVPPILNNVPERCRRPLYITEFGVRGFEENHKVEPGAFWDDRQITDTNVQAAEIGWFMIEAINRGFVAMVQWDMADVWYDRRMHYGVIGEPSNGWKLKPGYFLLKMFAQTTRPGWSSVRVNGSEPAESVAAMRSSLGEWTVFVLNRNDQARPFRIDGLPATGMFSKIIWQGKRLVNEGPWEVHEGRLESTLLPMSVTAFTSVVGGLESRDLDEKN